MDKCTVLRVGDLCQHLPFLRFWETVINHLVPDAVVMEGDDQVIDDGVSQPKFKRHIAVEERQNILVVHSFGCGSEAEKKLRFEIFYDFLVAVSYCMVALVDDNVFKCIRREQLKVSGH